MGNAAIAGIQHENAIAQQKQAKQSNVFGMLGTASQNSPALAYELGPYGAQYNGSGISDQALADYEGSGLPLLASSDAASTYAGVHGASDSPDYLTLSGSDSGMDDRWSFVAQVKQGGGPVVDPTQMPQQDWDEYVHDYSNLGEAPQGVTTLATINVDGSTAQGEDNNAWSLATMGTGVGGVAATGSSSGSYGRLSYAAAAPNANMADTDALESFAAGLGLAGTAADGGHLLSKWLGKNWGVSIDWGNPAGYDEVLLNNGGKLPAWLAGPEVKNINVGADAGTLRDADYVVDLSKVSKLTPWLEFGSHALGLAGVGFEAWDAYTTQDGGKAIHTGVDAAVYGSTVLAPIMLGTEVGGPVGFAIGLGWTVLDQSMSHYTYQGQQGWGAAAKEYGDVVNRVRQANPGFMVEKW